MNIEAIIPAAPKDYNKLPYVLRSIDAYLPEISMVHIISPEAQAITESERLKVVCHSDKEVLYFDRSRFAWRPNWVYQQFLKLFQDVTESDLFLVLDSDILFNRPTSLIDNGKPVFLLGRDQNFGPYFNFNMRMLGIGRTYDHSFLSECTLYSKTMIQEMVFHAGFSTALEFVNYAATIINVECMPAEAELYGSYVYRYYPEMYVFRHLRSSMQGRYGGHIWTDDEITALIDEMSKRDDVDIYTMHTWEGTP